MKPVVASAGIRRSAMLFTIRGASTHDEAKKQDRTVISMKGEEAHFRFRLAFVRPPTELGD
jgi:hypothetical protein